jgi:hypothetical protein
VLCSTVLLVGSVPLEVLIFEKNRIRSFSQIVTHRGLFPYSLLRMFRETEELSVLFSQVLLLSISFCPARLMREHIDEKQEFRAPVDE